MKHLIKKISFNYSDFTINQLDTINKANSYGLKIDKYLNTDIDVIQMKCIFEGLRLGLDVSQYDDWTRYSGEQMYEIFSGLRSGIDVKLYASEKFSTKQMRVIRKCIEKNYNNCEYLANPKFSEEKMFELSKALENNIDITEFANNDFNDKQIKCIVEALTEEIEFKPFINPNITDEKMNEVLKFLYNMEEYQVRILKEVNYILNSNEEVDDFLNKFKKMIGRNISPKVHDIYNRNVAIVYFNGKFYTDETHSMCINRALDEQEREKLSKDFYRPKSDDIEKIKQDKDVMFCAHLVENPYQTYYNDGTENHKAIYILNQSHLLVGVTIEEAAQILKNSEEYGDYSVFDDEGSYIDFELQKRVYRRLAKLKKSIIN